MQCVALLDMLPNQYSELASWSQFAFIFYSSIESTCLPTCIENISDFCMFVGSVVRSRNYIHKHMNVKSRYVVGLYVRNTHIH